MKTKRITSLILALVIIFSAFGGLNLTVYAQHIDFTDYTLNDSQKKELNKTVKMISSDLNLKSKNLSSFQKTRRIYNFLCSSVKYDETTRYDVSYYMHATAYAALINGTSVCCGFAEAFDLLAKEAGLKSEIIESPVVNNEGHAWNIVKIGSYYYNIDATWDSYNPKNYKYFLKCNSDFENCRKSGNHKRLPEYKTSAFNKRHPMASKSYNVGKNTCSHKNKKSLYGRKSTCKVGYHGGGSLCKDCGTVIKCTNNGSKVSCKKSWITVYEASCNFKGCKELKCEYCHRVYKKASIPKTGHDFSKKVTVKATCTEGGYTYLTCKKCGHEKKGSVKTIKKLGHKATKVVRVITPSTCTKQGTRMIYCSRCKKNVTDTMPVDSNAHKWDSGKITVEPTATTEGKKVYTCAYCHKTKTETVPATGVTQAEFISSKWSNEKSTRQLMWTQVSGYDGYQFYYATKSDFSDAKVFETEITNTVCKHTCSADKTYYYKIRAYKEVNGKRTYTPFSAIRCCCVKDGIGYYYTIK